MTSFEVVAPLLPRLLEPGDREALRAGGRSLSERELAAAASAVAHRLAGHGRVARLLDGALKLGHSAHEVDAGRLLTVQQ